MWALVLGLAGALAAAVLWSKVLAERRARDAERVRAESAERENSALRAAIAQEKANAKEDTARLELVILDLKQEIADVEADLGVCNAPGAIRERLRRLFADPKPVR